MLYNNAFQKENFTKFLLPNNLLYSEIFRLQAEVENLTMEEQRLDEQIR